MIEIPSEPWTDEQIESFRPIVENWTCEDLSKFFGTPMPDNSPMNMNRLRFHKRYKKRITEILKKSRPALMAEWKNLMKTEV